MSDGASVPDQALVSDEAPAGLRPSGFDPSREVDRLRALVGRIDDTIFDIVSRIEDEGDRVYLGSTNDVDTLRELMRETKQEVYKTMEAGVQRFMARCGPDFADNSPFRKEVLCSFNPELAAQGIEARSDETPQEVRPEGREPGPKDAPNPQGDTTHAE